jgi:prefoldin subunit 5
MGADVYDLIEDLKKQNADLEKIIEEKDQTIKRLREKAKEVERKHLIYTQYAQYR